MITKALLKQTGACGVNALTAFQRQMEAHGLGCPDPIIGDGELHRFTAPGDAPGSDNGWYVLHDDDNPNGVFASWKTGEQFKWSAKLEQDQSPAEREAFRKRIQAAKAQAEQERQRTAEDAAQRALTIWQKAQPAEDHPYLQKKGIQAHGLRMHEGCLVVPAYGLGGEIATLQFVGADGTKNFLRDGAKKRKYFMIGKPGDLIYVGEGFATMATIHEVTGVCVVVAFDAGNLLPVAERIQAEYAGSKIVFCADNDIGTEGNPGLTKAKAAAEAVGGSVVYPTFKQTSGNGKPFSDFNDLYVLEGPEAVLSQLQSIEKPGLTLKDAILNYACLMSLKLPERKTLYPWLPVGGIAMNYGPRGVGKTFFNLALAASLCTGSKLFSWDAPAQTGVLYCDGEMDIEQLRTRAAGLLQDPPGAPLSFLTSQYVYEKLQRDFKLSEASVRDELTAILDGNPAIRVLILDNISCLFSGIDEDSKQAWEPIAAWLIRLRHRGITTILSHHGGKSGQQRGTSGREDALDSVVRLSLPAGYVQTEGCHFHVCFEKCRSGKGQDLEPLDCKLEENSGTLVWTYKTLTLSNEERAAKHFAEGIESPSDLATEMGITRGYASKLLKRLRAQRQGGTL